MRSAASSEVCRAVNVSVVRRREGEPSPVLQGEGHGRGEEPGGSPEELPGVEGVERMEGDGGNRGGPPRPGRLRICPVGLVL